MCKRKLQEYLILKCSTKNHYLIALKKTLAIIKFKNIINLPEIAEQPHGKYHKLTSIKNEKSSLK
jgi:hypothetical protein